MAEHNVIAISFTDRGNAYQAYSELKGAALEGRVGVQAAAVVERGADGHFRYTDGVSNDGGQAAAGGGLIGLLVGVIGGPIGMLLGWGTGMLVGSLADLDRADKGAGALEEISDAVPPGSTAVVAEVAEYAQEVVDGLAQALGGNVIRRRAADVLAEMEAAEEAYRQAETQARQKARQQRSQERKESFEQRVGALKDKLGIGS